MGLKMESLNSVCPTEILVDLKDNDLPSHVNSKKNGSLEISKQKPCLRNEENLSSNRKHESYQSILDLSPSKINEECNGCKQNIGLKTHDALDLKLNEEASQDCPTAVLVDISSSSCFHLKEHLTPNSTWTDHRQHKLNLKEQMYMYSSNKNCSEIKESHDSPNLNEMQNQMSVKKLRWKTPSPQSMSRISKEATKVIQNLNSSDIFDEDSLLMEEILPIPINFDLDDNLDQDSSSSTSNVCEQDISDPVLSVNVQFQNSSTNTEIIDEESKVYLSQFEEVISSELPLEKHLSKMSLESSNDCDSNSRGLCSSRAYNASSVISDVSSSSFETDDVFIMKHNSYEDKENILEKENEAIFTKEIKSKTVHKSLYESIEKFGHRGTLRNLSNIKHEANVPVKCLYLPNNKKFSTTFKKLNHSAKLKETEFTVGKTQVKKSLLSVHAQNALKVTPQPNSFQLQNKKELLPNLQKPSSTENKAFISPICKSSNLKQLNVPTKMKTPSRRYSICTPLKSASAVRSALSPAQPNFQNSAIPKCTPQSTRASHLSFSRSLQQSTKAHHFSTGKGLIQHNSIPLSTSKVSYERINSAIQMKQSFSRSMSAVTSQSLRRNSMSTSSKGRFCSKLSLPSPLPVEQDKKLVRKLFP